ncbi:Xanthine and CO dehydrogenase maturation factor, XdhC/CoxF family [Hahella chejuensis KCTC 2396]|uniref:Xanthine and CO dehydrogenase maturation factor, XdhC/CoxF family n=1 Tax=Hahella chejuensis (strain KCTC 2396) TaxID=349521 RepID=Q2SMZ7_HAHCH|nr:xanthine dehydrogenase accessory protein XdhC [Hahella chejuensis]ABC27977.1 Xanthine and CO dehydrogenase maturation factor, XdhC/CoxF family [Hahella chejuensis KCTC 2396]
MYKEQWFEVTQRLSRSGQPFVLITLIGARGSTPRDSGTKMVVSADATFDTIGGGHLEFKATAMAREMLARRDYSQRMEHFPLGASLGQCCGGSATVLFEAFAPCPTQIALFGAGHVAKALVTILADLPVQVTWIDSREELFPGTLPANTQKRVDAYPCDVIDDLPDNLYYLILTHNHQLDYELAEKILRQDRFAYLGLIGSATKWARFRQRFDYRGVASSQVERVSCPVGLSAVPGKQPMEVAVSIAAELIGLYHTSESPTQQGVAWKDIKSWAADQAEPRDASDTDASTSTQTSSGETL